MAKEREWTPTPHSILPHIANMMKKLHTSLLDPCAGDGFTLDYLSKKWSCSRYGIEVDPNLFPEVKKIGKAISERFEDTYARGFTMAYVYPPPSVKNPTEWVRMVVKAMMPGGIVIWRLTKKTLQRPKVIDAMTELFKDWELYKDPPSTWEYGNHYIIRARIKDLNKRFTDQGQCFDFSQALEEAPTLGDAIIKEWDTPSGRGIKFRQRGLEWEDVYPDLMDALNEMEMPGTGEKLYFDSVKEWFEDTEDGNPHLIPDPKPATSSFGQCWSHGYTARDKKLYALVLVGRKTSLYAVESQLKRGRSIEIGYASFKLLGGATGAKEDFTVIVKTLPHTGAIVHIWVHVQCTRRARSDSGFSVFVPEDNDEMAAKMLSNALGIPIAPEWMDIASAAAGIQYRSHQNILGRHLGLHKEKIMTNNDCFIECELLYVVNVKQKWILPIEYSSKRIRPGVGAHAQSSSQLRRYRSGW